MVSLHLRAAAAVLGIVLSTSMIGALPAAAADNPGASAPAVTAPAAPADVAQSSDDDDSFSDVPPNHWAYQAVQELAADGYIKGYPDGTFRGNRPLTRYEMAALTDRALSAIKAALINGDDVNARDIAALKKLMTQYAGQLKDVQTQVTAIKAQQATLASQQSALSSQYSGLAAQEAALKAQADRTAAGLAANRGGLNFDYKPGNAFIDVEVTNGPYIHAAPAAAASSTGAAILPIGAAIPANAPFTANWGAYPGITRGATFAWGPGATQATYVGPTGQGITEYGVKPYIQGSLDAHFSYQVRLALIDQAVTPFGLTSTTPAYCTSAIANAGAGTIGSGLGAYPCVYQGARSNNAQLPITLDRYYIQWASQPGGNGFGALVGKISQYSNTGTRNINPLIGYGKDQGGGLFYRDSKTDWLEAAMSFGQTTGVSSEELSQVYQVSNSGLCTTVYGLNAGTTQSTTTGVNGYCNGNSNEMRAYVQLYNQNTGTALGWITDQLNDYVNAYWDPGAALCASSAANQAAGVAAVYALTRANCPAADAFPLLNASGGYLTAQGKIDFSSVWISQVIGSKNQNDHSPRTALQFDYGFRQGTDPFTGAAWAGNGTYQFTAVFGSKGNVGWGPGGRTYATIGPPGVKDSNNIFLTGLFTGMNSISPAQGPNGSWEGVGYNTGLSNFSATQFEAIQYAHWFSDNFNINIDFAHQGTLPGVTIPAGSTTCPGCYVDHVNSNLVFLSTWMSF